MTHSDIYTKFMIEYDKANITSSYPSLTKYEIATLLDKAYLAIIAQKLTGNNARHVGLEGDNKAIEDIRPLMVTSKLNKADELTLASNEYTYSLKSLYDYLYYIKGSLDIINYTNSIDDKRHVNVPVDLVTHEDADKFRSTEYNLPWMKNPVCFIENDYIHVLIDPFKYKNNPGTLRFNITYIKSPRKFVKDNLFDDTLFELSDSMAEELINLTLIFATESTESQGRYTTKTQTIPFES